MVTKGLIAGPTRWVLFLAAGGMPEDRHIKDLCFGFFCLERAGVNVSDITIYIDGQDRAAIAALMSLGTDSPVQIKETADFFGDLKTEVAENLVIFVTGHGSWDGIAGKSPIRPYPFLDALRGAAALRRAVVYFGQCYAGIFNYVKAGRGPSDQAEVIFIGATNLHSSLSSVTNEAMSKGSVNWVANIFLIHVFKWIVSPVDVDGDGTHTVMDSFKYASALANSGNISVKVSNSNEVFDLREAWVAAKAAHASAPSNQSKMTLDAAEAKYVDALEVVHVNQDGWILNAIPAQSIEF